MELKKRIELKIKNKTIVQPGQAEDEDSVSTLTVQAECVSELNILSDNLLLTRLEDVIDSLEVTIPENNANRFNISIKYFTSANTIIVFFDAQANVGVAN